MNNPLSQYRILLADDDVELSRVLRNMLGQMGFTNIQTTRSGEEAFEMVSHIPFDFLITEWNTRHMNGMDLIRHIRRSPDSPNPTLPVIMLTGRAEQTDVMTARDIGVNEYVRKPFSAQAVFKRLEHIIEQPRNFVMAKSFVGPDRRHLGKPPAGKSERRNREVKAQLQPKIIGGDIIAGAAPKIWLPDFTLKYKLGDKITLANLITPAVLKQAQDAIEAISQESLVWIKDDLRELEQLGRDLAAQSIPRDAMITALSDAALRLHSRTGTFGYSRAAEIAYMLYLFCRIQLDPAQAGQRMVVQKHIEVLSVLLGNQLKGGAGKMGEQVAAELLALAKKYTAS